MDNVYEFKDGMQKSIDALIESVTSLEPQAVVCGVIDKHGATHVLYSKIELHKYAFVSKMIDTELTVLLANGDYDEDE